MSGAGGTSHRDEYRSWAHVGHHRLPDHAAYRRAGGDRPAAQYRNQSGKCGRTSGRRAQRDRPARRAEATHRGDQPQMAGRRRAPERAVSRQSRTGIEAANPHSYERVVEDGQREFRGNAGDGRGAHRASRLSRGGRRILVLYRHTDTRHRQGSADAQSRRLHDEDLRGRVQARGPARNRAHPRFRARAYAPRAGCEDRPAQGGRLLRSHPGMDRAGDARSSADAAVEEIDARHDRGRCAVDHVLPDSRRDHQERQGDCGRARHHQEGLPVCRQVVSAFRQARRCGVSAAGNITAEGEGQIAVAGGCGRQRYVSYRRVDAVRIRAAASIAVRSEQGGEKAAVPARARELCGRASGSGDARVVEGQCGRKGQARGADAVRLDHRHA